VGDRAGSSPVIRTKKRRAFCSPFFVLSLRWLYAAFVLAMCWLC